MRDNQTECAVQRVKRTSSVRPAPPAASGPRPGSGPRPARGPAARAFSARPGPRAPSRRPAAGPASFAQKVDPAEVRALAHWEATRTGQRRCGPGTFCLGGLAFFCPAGTFGAGEGLASEECSGRCFAGTYCPAGTGVAPPPCPRASTAPTGSGAGPARRGPWATPAAWPRPAARGAARWGPSAPPARRRGCPAPPARLGTAPASGARAAAGPAPRGFTAPKAAPRPGPGPAAVRASSVPGAAARPWPWARAATRPGATRRPPMPPRSRASRANTAAAAAAAPAGRAPLGPQKNTGTRKMTRERNIRTCHPRRSRLVIAMRCLLYETWLGSNNLTNLASCLSCRVMDVNLDIKI